MAELREKQQAVGEAEVLGFETASDWTASTGTTALSSTRSQGSSSLAVTTSGWVQISSRALSNLPGVGDELKLDVRVPEQTGWGAVQISFDAPSLGLHSSWIGQASLAGLAPGSFHQLSFAVPAQVKTALAGNYSDLVVHIALGVPSSNSPYLLDNLRFAGDVAEPDCADGSAFTLNVTGEEALPASFVEDMRCTFYSVYPALVSRFNLSAPTTVGMHFVDEPGVAWASGADTYYAIDAMLPYPYGTDVVVHEIMHVIQGGYVSNVPGWYIEGSADYVRDAFGLRNAEGEWFLPDGYEYGRHYRNGYGVTAAFFKWIDATYRQNQTPVVDAIDDLARAGTYSLSSWEVLTGHDLDTLWYQYSDGVAPVPATSGVRFYGDSNYQGDASYLGVGSYDVSDLGARGINNDWISTIQIPSGYTVTVYEHGGYQGASAVYTSDVIFWNEEQWNDQISSVVITQP